mmetsp:Transcript_30515/g.36259  ORF Transcript_30515/g.36259 Transcript_30515/m.36259 type:complete len:85 (-) Transcript_30515:191-445(-)
MWIRRIKGCMIIRWLFTFRRRGEEFDGGSFVFRDADGDESVEPKVGRCLLFSSGFNYLHQVLHVTRGERVIMGLWFTLQVDKIN